MFSSNRWFCAFIAAALLVTVVGMPDTASAQYHDNSGNLPGTMSGGDVLLYGLGAAAVIIVASMIMRAASADEPERAEEESPEGEGEGEGESESWEDSLIPSPQPRFRTASANHECGSLAISARKHPLELMAGVAPGGDGVSEVRVVVGMAVSF